MRPAALIGLLALLMSIIGHAAETPGDGLSSPRPDATLPGNPAAPEDRAFRLEQPALWIPGVKSRAEAGKLPPQLDTNRGRLILGEKGLLYTERAGNRVSELLAIPYARVISVSTDLSGHAVAFLFVTEASEPTGSARSHLFLFLQDGPFEAGTLATRAQALIENRIAETSRIADGGVREEKVAVSVAQWQPAVVFGDPRPVVAGRSNLFAESVLTGGQIGGAPLIACIACPPELFVPVVAMFAAGIAAGAVVGVVRELAASLEDPPLPLPGFAPQQTLASAPAFARVTFESLSQSAVKACLINKLSAGGAEAGAPQWHTIGRRATVSQVMSIGSALPDEPGSYTSLARDGYRYAIESHLTQVLFVPMGEPGQKPDDVPAAIVVEGGFNFIDLQSGQSNQGWVYWRTAPRPLADWSADNGSALTDELKNACDGLAGKIADEAKRLWQFL